VLCVLCMPNCTHTAYATHRTLTARTAHTTPIYHNTALANGTSSRVRCVSGVCGLCAVRAVCAVCELSGCGVSGVPTPASCASALGVRFGLMCAGSVCTVGVCGSA
jgi:hypothetical protein